MIGTLAPPQSTTDSGAVDGFKKMLPAAVGVLPFATMIGVALGNSPVSNLAGFVGGLLIAGGSAQIAAIGSMTVGTGVIATVVTALMINARGLLYGAALAPSLRHQPTWFRWIAAYGLVDQMFALVSEVVTRSDRYVRSFYLGAMAILWIGFFSGVALGLTVGPVIPESIPLGICIPVMFVSMLVPSLQARPSYIAAILAGVVALAASALLPSGIGLLVAVVAGSGAGILADRTTDA